MTGLHLSTVGMSVRNALVMLAFPKTVQEIAEYLDRAWPVRSLELGEVSAALAELERRGLVRASALEGLYQATDSRFFRGRAREQEGMSDDDHWEGWTT